ncbi:MAG: DUF4924 family protein [Bacteroides sp.]|nr:DUF4924 family protein [Bacteroides sp.]
MFIASEKRRSNIAEYLLYMWQIEDIIRANSLDIEKINERIIAPYPGLADEQRTQLREWYESLIDMMRREGVVESGHLQINRSVLSSLVALHQTLLADPKFADYSSEFYRTLPFIVELRAKSGENKSGEIETCFNALYAILLMRLQGKEITAETASAITQISKLIAMLSHYFVLDESGKLFDNKE